MKIKSRQLEIINAAGKIITEYGVGSLTIRNLAEKMEFGESALYRHFKSKDEIVLTMLNFIAEDFKMRFAQTLERYTDPEEQLQDLFRSQLEFFTLKPHFLIPVISDGLFEKNEKINDALKKTMLNTKGIFTQIIKKGQDDGVFRNDIGVEELVHIFMGSFRLLMFEWRTSGFKANIQEKGGRLMGGLFKMIRIAE